MRKNSNHGSLKESYYLEDIDADGRITLEMV
jgi:hypothetical protein